MLKATETSTKKKKKILQLKMAIVDGGRDGTKTKLLNTLFDEFLADNNLKSHAAAICNRGSLTFFTCILNILRKPRITLLIIKQQILN